MQNYHKHSWFSNVLVTDCATDPSAYVKRAWEVGHQVISSVEHGYQSNYYDIYDLVTEANESLAKQLNDGLITKEEYDKKKLKFIFGAEAYWVRDRQKEYEYEVTNAKGETEIKLRKDRTNCHIILLAKNEEGRRDINDALAEANISGFYGQPRLDLELLYKIKPENVFVTTACLKYWAYDDIEDITLALYKHFKNNFYLEIQCHNTDRQKEINRKILEMHYKYGIGIICGLDSHYIYPEDEVERNNYLEGRGITYDEDERGWYMDYPDDDEVRRRLKEQGVLNDSEIEECMSTSDLLLDFDDITFDKDIKLPSVYPDKSQEWKDNKLRELVYYAWDKEKKNVQVDRWEEYEEGIEYELSAIFNTKMTDYFLLDYEIVKRGVANGGIITKTGRGSGVSYYVNSLLGFSNIDRFISPVVLYPDRFMSETRILLTRSLPDLDLNLGNPEVFAKAQDDVLTEAYGTPNHSYPMISYKPLQKSSAFKLYAKAKGLDFEIANKITTDIAKYEKALKHAESKEERDALDIHNYVDKEYHSYLDESVKYQGIINTKSPAPCGYLIYQGDIKREIGLIRCVSGQGKNQHSVLTTVTDGMVAEHYKFVKNDLLKVDVWLTINQMFSLIDKPTPTVHEMTKLIDGDEATWRIYENGYTCGVNQFDSDFAKRCCTEYKPKNIRELTALVAALRPGFKTQLDNFLARKPYTTGVKELDDLLIDSYHYILYQENCMTYLGWLGIPQTETYAIIKKISKKKFKDKELAELKAELLQGWIKNTGREDGFEQTWEIVDAFAKYAFNASHSVSYAYDSVYSAYFKAHYPYEFYATMLQTYTDKGDKKKVALFKSEMKEAFGINEGDYRFRLDNRQFTIDKTRHCINPSLSSINGFGGKIAEELYEIRNCPCKTFVDLLIYMKENTGIGDSVITNLIKIDYFSEFGNSNLLLHIMKTFKMVYDSANKRFKKQISKASLLKYGLTDGLVKPFAHKETEKTYLMVDMYGMLCEMETTKMKPLPDYRRASYQQVFLKNTKIIDRNASNVCVVADVDDKYTPKVNGYSLKNGGYHVFKIPKRTFANKPLMEGDVIQIRDSGFQPKCKYENGKRIPIPDEKELWVTTYEVIFKSELKKSE